MGDEREAAVVIGTVPAAAESDVRADRDGVGARIRRNPVGGGAVMHADPADI